MEKVCRGSAAKTSFIPLFNFAAQPKTGNACKGLLEILKEILETFQKILKETMRKLT